jgi:hypothetical protein
LVLTLPFDIRYGSLGCGSPVIVVVLGGLVEFVLPFGGQAFVGGVFFGVHLFDRGWRR